MDLFLLCCFKVFFSAGMVSVPTGDGALHSGSLMPVKGNTATEEAKVDFENSGMAG